MMTIRRIKSHLITLLSLLALSAFIAACSSNAEVEIINDAESEIWAKELAIFEGRGEGDLSNYVNSASMAYLGWPPSLEKPSTRDNLVAMAAQSSALKGEVTEITKKGFTRDGDTAIVYFLTHRTRLGVGFAEEDARDVNQYFENIHVWTLEDGEWRLIAGMARKPPEDGPRM